MGGDPESRIFERCNALENHWILVCAGMTKQSLGAQAPGLCPLRVTGQRAWEMAGSTLMWQFLSFPMSVSSFRFSPPAIHRRRTLYEVSSS
jgi:hypothetical protein